MMRGKLKFFVFVLVIAVCVCAFAGCADGGKNNSIDKYSVVYADGNSVSKTVAESIARGIGKKYGTEVNCISDSVADTGYEIVVGTTNRTGGESAKDGKYCISQKGKKKFLQSDSASGIVAAAKVFLFDVSEGKTNYKKSKSAAYNDLSLKVMSFNIRTTGENRWDRLKNVILRNDPDILGTQEVSTNWQNKLKTDLPGYTCVGEGRGDSGDEAGYIFFKTDDFELLESGTRWYTNTPEKPSKLPDSTYTRIYTYAHLLRESDGEEFVFVNTHLDLNQGARMESVGMLINYLEEKFDLPCYITGDFNTGENLTYKNGKWGSLEPQEYDVDDLLADNGYLNSRLVAVNSDEHHTYPTSLYPSDANAAKRIIDYCFVKGTVLVESYKVDSELPDEFTAVSGCGNDASDHYPIVSETYLYSGI